MKHLLMYMAYEQHLSRHHSYALPKEHFAKKPDNLSKLHIKGTILVYSTNIHTPTNHSAYKDPNEL